MVHLLHRLYGVDAPASMSSTLCDLLTYLLTLWLCVELHTEKLCSRWHTRLLNDTLADIRPSRVFSVSNGTTCFIRIYCFLFAHIILCDVHSTTHFHRLFSQLSAVRQTKQLLTRRYLYSQRSMNKFGLLHELLRQLCSPRTYSSCST